MSDKACEHTDVEIWRKKEGDYYGPSIHVTEQGDIGMNVGGLVIVLPVEKWHSLASGIELYQAALLWSSRFDSLTVKDLRTFFDEIELNVKILAAKSKRKVK